MIEVILRQLFIPIIKEYNSAGGNAMLKTTSRHYKVLERIIALRHPECAPALKKIQAGCLPPLERDELIEIVASELCTLGLAADGEPTAYGEDLDNLIGELLVT